MSLWCTKTSFSSPSTEMKPKPFSTLNHLHTPLWGVSHIMGVRARAAVGSISASVDEASRAAARESRRMGWKREKRGSPGLL